MTETMVDEAARTLIEETESLCPECLRAIPGELIERGGAVWLEKACARHGEFRALIASDATEFLRLRQYRAVRDSDCCCGPSGCGKPPVCVLLLEITRACNLRCPTCYADARGHDHMTLDEARHRLDTFFSTQTSLDVLMLSGGEPTVHPEFTRFLDMALEYPVQRVLINTNGLAIAKRPEIVVALRAHRKRIELYFSFSSFRAENHHHFYGADLREVKQQALQVAAEAGLFTTLVAVVERGVNDDELGDLYRFGLSQPSVTGLTLQPTMTAGRYEHDYEAARRATTTDTLHWLQEQTGGDLLSSDFVALPCSHPDCCTLTYGFLDKDRTTMRPLTRTLDVRRYLELFSDRISFDGMVGKVARRVWSDVTNLRAGQTLRDLTALFRRGGVKDAMWVANDPEAFGRRVFRVVVKPFMDANTYDVKRVDQCCTKILTEGGEAISFCEYNVLHRPVAGRKAIPLKLVVR